MTSPDQHLALIAQRQAGAFTRLDALGAGFTPSQISSRLARGTWVAVHPDVYCAGTTKLGREARAVAARLYAGDDALFSHFTAARLQAVDLPVVSRSVWVTVPYTRQLSRRPGVEIFRTRHKPLPPTMAHRQPVTPMPRTVVDLAQFLDHDQLTAVTYDVVRRGAAEVEHLLAIADELRGRAGLGVLRRVLKEFDPEFESMAEVKGAAVLAAAGLDLVRQFEVYDDWMLVARIDLADPEIKLAIEIDGHCHDVARAQFRDRQRDRALTRLGWTVIRFTGREVYRAPDQMIRDAAAARDEAGRRTQLVRAA